MAFKPTHLVLHTLAFRGNADVEMVRAWHLQRGWSDIGYHFLILRSGEIQAGRPKTIKGAHTRDGGYNNFSLGIACEGHGDFDPWTVPQLASLIRLCRELSHEYEIPVVNIIGHRESGALKTCPGTLIDMDHIRTLLEAGNVQN